VKFDYSEGVLGNESDALVVQLVLVVLNAVVLAVAAVAVESK